MFQFFKNKLMQAKNKAANILYSGREILTDVFVSTPYVVIDSILYISTALQFLDSFNKDENDDTKWSKPQYIILSILASALAISYYCTFSKTNAKLFNLKNDSIYSKVKDKIRKILGIPSALIKTSIGASALYMFAKKKSSTSTALSLSIASWLSALPAMTALLWSEHTKSNYISLEPDSRQNIKRILKYFFIHTLTLFYALDNTSLYFWSTINMPMRLGIIDHDLSDYQNRPEQFFYYFSYLVAAFPFFAVYISYAHLNENMFGLTANENKNWTLFKSKAKKITGPIAAGAKVINAGVSTYGFLGSKMPKASNIMISTVGSISGLITQCSVLVADPIQENDNSGTPSRPSQNKQNNLIIQEDTFQEDQNDIIPLVNFIAKN